MMGPVALDPTFFEDQLNRTVSLSELAFSDMPKTTSPMCPRAILLRHYAAAVSSLIRLASASMAKGLVSTCMPGSRWPLPTTAFSA